MHTLLSTLLNRVRAAPVMVTGVTASAPWGVEFMGMDSFAYHILIEGEALLTEQSRPRSGTDFLLPTGTLAIVAPNVPFMLRSGRIVLSESLETMEKKTKKMGQGWKLYDGGSGSICRLISGTFMIDTALTPILEPTFTTVSVFDQSVLNSRFTQLVELIMGELKDERSGAAAIIERYAEILFLEMLRGFATQNLSSLGIFAALHDPNLTRALAAFHTSPGKGWTIQALADQAGMSPATFKRTFGAYLSVSPHDYVLRWRLLEAARRLRETDQSITQISEIIGFASNTSFTKAFRRIYECAPSTYREFHRHEPRRATWI